MTTAEQTSFLFAQNAPYIRNLLLEYQNDPNRVDETWRRFFSALEEEERAALTEAAGPSWGATSLDAEGLSAIDRAILGDGFEAAPAVAPAAAQPTGYTPAPMGLAVGDPTALRAATLDSIRALMLIRAFRVRGHLEAQLDPLKLENRRHHPELDPKTYGFSEADWDRPIFINYVLGWESATLRQIVTRCRETYCGSIGVEFMHIQDPEQKAWIQERIEGVENRTNFTVNGKKAILERLTAAEVFENFLNKKYTGTKRFGLDGSESLIPAIEQIMKRGGQLGLEEIVLGMAHRGRLNVLANVMGKRPAAIFSEFQGSTSLPDEVQGSGDVKYHLGTSSDRDFDGNVIHLSLTANPSHLEAVNPVVIGKVRAKQLQRQDIDRTKVLGLLLHGDAAIAGQGVVAETLLLSELKGYRTGGTIHFVINNQIGFTTSPSYSRSSPYPTDITKTIQAPIFHVNGDDPEAVVHVSRIGIEFRQKFNKDVVIDMFCYRRFGHNEGDEPAFTQPKMYDRIKQVEPVRKLYAYRLIEQNIITRGEMDGFVERYERHLDDEFEGATGYKPNKADWFEGKWKGFGLAAGGARRGQTGVPREQLQAVGRALCHFPKDHKVHSKIQRQLKNKLKAIDSGEGVDWATAEALAFGTLLQDGYPVRLSGQDSGRGTFSQRHSVLFDQDNEERYVPLNNIPDRKAHYEVHDSPLSEFAVLGYEYGYSLAEPKALVLWEAQFGDFANGAQVMLDQFISAGELKWHRMSGLVMLLPHGYEGQGPEHSSARLERFLQMCGEDNWQVCNITTPANYFHALRRQLHRDFRKPLVIVTPKSLLRHKECLSSLDMMDETQTFHRVLYEDRELAPNEEIRRVVMCSGKVYYDLAAERDSRGIKDVTILRLEQLYPFPDHALQEEMKKYPNADVIWCQEEPENMGGWSFVDRRIEKSLTSIGHKTSRPVYAGRAEAAAPATGLISWHQREQANLVDRALTIQG